MEWLKVFAGDFFYQLYNACRSMAQTSLYYNKDKLPI